MGPFTILDGLILTIVAMVVVFVVLAAIWGFVELTSKIITYFEQKKTKSESPADQPTRSASPPLAAHPKHQKAAEIMALVLASEDRPDKKFEIVESKRVK